MGSPRLKGLDGFLTPFGMASDLVQRHSDIGFIQGYVKAQFGRSPSREMISDMRTRHLAKEARKAEAHKSAYRS